MAVGAGGTSAPTSVSVRLPGGLGPRPVPLPGSGIAEPFVVALRVKRQWFKAIYDTAANVSVISRRVVEALPKGKGKRIVTPREATLLAFSGGAVVSKGVIQVPVDVQAVVDGRDIGGSTQMVAYVVPALNVSVDIIIGAQSIMSLPPSNPIRRGWDALVAGRVLRFPANNTGIRVSAVDVESIPPQDTGAVCSITLVPPPIPGEEDREPATGMMEKGLLQEESLTRADIQARISKDYSPEHQRRLGELLYSHRVVFSRLHPQGALLTPLEIKLHPDAVPFHVQNSIPVKPEVAKATEAALGEFLELGIIREVEPHTVKWRIPALTVPKSDGGVRIVVDGRPLNNWWTNPNRDVMPDATAILDSTLGFKVWSTVDCKHGFLQMPLHPASVQYGAFSLLGKTYVQLRGLMGFAGTPQAFHREIAVLLREVPRKVPCVLEHWIDDILIGTADEESHLLILAELIKVLNKHRLRLSLKKSTFMARRAHFIGVELDGTTKRMDPDRMDAVRNLAPIRTVPALRNFLGIGVWHSATIKGYADKVAYLQQFVRTGANITKVRDSKEFLEAVESLRQAILENVSLHIPDLSRPFTVAVDASKTGIGAVLLQEHAGELAPLAYHSQLLKPSQLSWTVGEKEFFALYTAVLRWWRYLYMGEFQVLSDHANLLYLPKTASLRIQRLYSDLTPYRFKVVRVPGSSNVVPDALSRLPHSPPPRVSAVLAEEMGATEPSEPHVSADPLDAVPLMKEIWLAQQAASPELRAAWDSDTFFHKQVYLGHTFYKYKGAFHIPAQATDLQKQLLVLAHDRAGHPGRDETLERLKKTSVGWIGMAEAVEAYVRACSRCLHAKTPSTYTQAGELLTQATVPRPWQAIAMDFAGPLMGSSGYNYILVMVDKFTRWVELAPAVSPTADEVIQLFRKHIVNRYGAPEVIFSDPGSHFKNEAFAKFCRDHNIRHHISTAGHPESNGAVERQMWNIKARIKAVLAGQVDRWADVLDEIQWHLNTSTSRVTRTTPFEAVFGMKPRTELAAKAGTPLLRVPPEQLAEFREAINDLMSVSIAATHSNMKRDFDRRHQPTTWAIGSKVLLANPHKPGSGLHFGTTGPYQVIREVRANYYEIAPLLFSGPSRVVHVQRLKPYDASRLDETKAAADQLPPEHYLVEKIVAHRLASDGKSYEFRVKWVDYSSQHNTWEPATGNTGNAAFQAYWKAHGFRPNGTMPTRSVPKAGTKAAPVAGRTTRAGEKK